MEKISVIISCYNEEKTVPHFYKSIAEIAERMKPYVDFEFLFVNDGSRDETLSVIKKIVEKDNRVRYISFSRNFGKEAAMYAGLKNANGDYITLMDADLQHPPELLVKMYEYIKSENYDQVATIRVSRKGEPKIRSFFSDQFYKIIKKTSKVDMVAGAGDYRLFTKQVAEAILQLKEYNRYSKGIFSFVGFETKYIEYENVERVAGDTKWSFISLVKYAVEGIVSFSTVPLKISIFFGMISCIFASMTIIIIIARTILYGEPVDGWPTIMCVMLFLGGIQLFCMGIQGEYIAKSYEEIKGRPIYIVKETEEDGKDNKIKCKI